MSLPYMSDKSIMRPTVRTQFGGLNNNLAARDGEIVWMENMSSREFPLLTPRNQRAWVQSISDPYGLGARDALYWVSGTGFYYDGVLKGTVAASPKQFAAMGNRIIIFPDKKYYDIDANTFGDLELSISTFPSPAYSYCIFKNGTLGGIEAKANEVLWLSTTPDLFSPGDVIEISGCVGRPENNKKLIVREAGYESPYNYIRFDENALSLKPALRYTVGSEGLAAGTYIFRDAAMGQASMLFTLDQNLSEGDMLTYTYGDYDASSSEYMFAVIGGVSQEIRVTGGSWTGYTLLTFDELPGMPCKYTEQGPITFKRAVPNLAFVCVNENRLWGCEGDTIYASALGDPFNFYTYEGLSTDSWTSAVPDEGDFTACVSYGGYPIFFKEESIYKVQGDKPSNFQWTLSSRFGVKEGSANSLAVAGETLFYLSRAGVCSYNGGAPRVVSEALGANTRWQEASGGSDGIRYYVSLRDYDDSDVSGLYVFDTRYGVWHREDESYGLFAFCYESLYMVTNTGELYRLDEDTDYGTLEDPITWQVVFADSDNFYETTDTASQNKKGGPLRILIRATLAENSTIEIKIRYDDGSTKSVGTITGTSSAKKKTYILPLILRRCDHYRLSMDGYGDAVVYSIAVERYSGSQFQGSSSVSLPNEYNPA